MWAQAFGLFRMSSMSASTISLTSSCWNTHMHTDYFSISRALDGNHLDFLQERLPQTSQVVSSPGPLRLWNCLPVRSPRKRQRERECETGKNNDEEKKKRKEKKEKKKPAKGWLSPSLLTGPPNLYPPPPPPNTHTHTLKHPHTIASNTHTGVKLCVSGGR